MWRRILHARWPWLVLAGAVIAAYLSTLVEIRARDNRPLGSADDIAGLSERTDVNVLFFLVDTLRAHHLGSYGYDRDTSPTIDYLASNGVRFARHLAQSSWTKCSMASLWTGLNPGRTRMTRVNHSFPSEARFPAEIMRDAGFRTAGIYRNGWVDPNFGFGQGFEIYDKPRPAGLHPSVRRENPNLTLQGTDDEVIDSAIEFLRVYGKQRWFLYVHTMDVHQYLYDEDSARFGTRYMDIYDNSILRQNGIIGRLLTYLAEEHLLDKTLIVIASDHGEAFGERGLEGHARRVFRETTEVPLVISLPFRLEPAAVVETRTANVDVWPTLLDLLGLPPLDNPDGRSLVPTMLAAARGEQSQDDERPAYAHIDQTWGQRGRAERPMVAVAEGDFRYVLRRLESGDQEFLFDRRGDARERRNVIGEQPELAARLRGLAEAYLDNDEPTPWGTEGPDVELGEMELNQLRALGYAIP